MNILMVWDQQTTLVLQNCDEQWPFTPEEAWAEGESRETVDWGVDWKVEGGSKDPQGTVGTGPKTGQLQQPQLFKHGHMFKKPW